MAASDEHAYYANETQREAAIRGMARKLAKFDPLKSPTRYARLLADLAAAKAEHAHRKRRGPADDNSTETTEQPAKGHSMISVTSGVERLPSDPRPFYTDVTPSMARKWLSPDINSHNRKIITNAVAFYADAMEHNEWAVTGESIQFAGDIDGTPTLLNGQHRLEAIAQTGITQRILIVDHLDPDVFSVLDTGKVRGFKDVLSAMGEVDASKVAAAARLAYLVEHGMATSSIGGGATKVSNVRLQQWFEHHPEFAKYSNESGALRKATPINSSAAMVALWQLHQIDKNAADEFFTGLRTGANLDTGDARLTLRNWLIRNGTSERGVVHLAMIFKAWNGWRNNRDVKVLRWNPEAPTREVFPEPSL